MLSALLPTLAILFLFAGSASAECAWVVSVFVPVTVLAQTQKDISSEGIPGTGYKYGVGSIKDLPPSQPLLPGSPSPPSNLPYLTPHPDALREYQQRMLRERLDT